MLVSLALEVCLVTALVTMPVAALMVAARRWPGDDGPLVDAVDALLPQTQCAQCGYPGCRPYARAVVDGETIDLCAPGGAETQLALARLLERKPGALLAAAPAAQVALIDESRCIGCYLCIPACPVDAIVGAPRYVHTVIAERCTGCELCVAPCPVDCIDLVATAAAAAPLPAPEPPASGCIRCNACEPVCPEQLPVQALWWQARRGAVEDAVPLGLDRCIECGLCNAECPSGIDLVGTFRSAHRRHERANQAHAAAGRARQHVAEHDQRLAREAAAAAARRENRIRRLGSGN